MESEVSSGQFVKAVDASPRPIGLRSRKRVRRAGKGGSARRFRMLLLQAASNFKLPRTRPAYQHAHDAS